MKMSDLLPMTATGTTNNMNLSPPLSPQPTSPNQNQQTTPVTTPSCWSHNLNNTDESQSSGRTPSNADHVNPMIAFHPQRDFDGSSSVAAAASTSSHRSIISNYSSDLEEEDDHHSKTTLADNRVDSSDALHGLDYPSAPYLGASSQSINSPQPCAVTGRVQREMLHQRRLQQQAAVLRSRDLGRNNLSSSRVREELGDVVRKEFERGWRDVAGVQKKESDRIMAFLQTESNRRSAIESRLHAQLLLQAESMVAMELKLLRLEAKVEKREVGSRGRMVGGPPRVNIVVPAVSTIDEEDPRVAGRNVLSSGASLVSALTSGLEDVGEDESFKEANTDEEVGSVSDGDLPPTSVQNITAYHPILRTSSNIDSILLNPLPPPSSNISLSSYATQNESTRAVCPDPTEASSLATSVTSATLTSTVITQTTASVANISNAPTIPRDGVQFPTTISEVNNNINPVEGDLPFGLTGPNNRPLRSRSNSPLTVPSFAAQSTANETTYSTSTAGIMSTAAIAPSRDFRSRRVFAPSALRAETPSETAASGQASAARPLTNRVVSFVPPKDQESIAGDSLTMGEDLAGDDLSDVVDEVERQVGRWREEYEARLDVIQKRWGME